MAYTYYIYHEPTKQHYYGARWARTADPSDFWVTYFTSSRPVKQLIEQYGRDSFSVQIRKVFECGLEARRWEHRVLKRIRACSRKEWLNTSNGQPPICNYSRLGQGRGRFLSEQHKQSISTSHRGKSKPQTDEHKAKGAAARRGTKRTDETRNLMSKSSRAAKQTYVFTKLDHTFCGNMSDWAEYHNLNVKSAATCFCLGKPYKGWVRVLS
jgi:hypothetical protein